MNPRNTPTQIDFFRVMARGDLQSVREFIHQDGELLRSFDYRNFGATPLTAACFSGRTELVEMLLELGADPNQRSDWHMGPWSPLHCCIFRRDKALAKYLLANGATLDLHTAAGLGDGNALRELLNGAPDRVFERGGDGCYPLHFADSIEIAQMLLEHGAEIDGRCIDHFSTAAQYLCSVRPEVARFLFSQGAAADIFSIALSGDDARLSRLLDEKPELLEARINQVHFPPGNGHDVHNILTFTVGFEATVLHAAAKSDRTEAIFELKRRGIDLNVRGGYDHATALHLAAWSNLRQAAQGLIECGADVEARSGNLHNNTPAGWAIVAGSVEVFELLLDQGARCHSWFLDDAKDACAGRFDTVSHCSHERRQRILHRLS